MPNHQPNTLTNPSKVQFTTSIDQNGNICIEKEFIPSEYNVTLFDNPIYTTSNHTPNEEIVNTVYYDNIQLHMVLLI